MTPFPLGCGLCKSDQAELLTQSIEVVSEAKLRNLLNQTLAAAKGPITLSRSRALSSINTAARSDKKAKLDFQKRQLAVKALQTRLKQSNAPEKVAYPSSRRSVDKSVKDSDVVVLQQAAAGIDFLNLNIIPVPKYLQAT